MQYGGAAGIVGTIPTERYLVICSGYAMYVFFGAFVCVSSIHADVRLSCCSMLFHAFVCVMIQCGCMFHAMVWLRVSCYSFVMCLSCSSMVVCAILQRGCVCRAPRCVSPFSDMGITLRRMSYSSVMAIPVSHSSVGVPYPKCVHEPLCFFAYRISAFVFVCSILMTSLRFGNLSHKISWKSLVSCPCHVRLFSVADGRQAEGNTLSSAFHPPKPAEITIHVAVQPGRVRVRY